MPLTLQPFGNASAEQIGVLEAEIGYSLPDKYRQWLRDNNGADIPGGAGNRSSAMYLKYLFGIRPDKLDDDLLFRRETIIELTDDYLPIAAPDDGVLAIKLTDPGRGTIWYLDGENIGIEFDYRAEGYNSLAYYLSATKLEKVGDNFDDFLTHLEPISDILKTAPFPGQERSL